MKIEKKFNAHNIIELGNNINKIGDFSFDIFEMKKICKEKTMKLFKICNILYHELFFNTDVIMI